MDRAFMDEYYDKMRADDIEELSSQRNEDYSDRADDYKAAKQALLEGLGLSHLFSGNRKLTPEEKELIINTPITIDCFEKWNDYKYEQIILENFPNMGKEIAIQSRKHTESHTG